MISSFGGHLVKRFKSCKELTAGLSENEIVSIEEALLDGNPEVTEIIKMGLKLNDWDMKVDENAIKQIIN